MATKQEQAKHTPGPWQVKEYLRNEPSSTMPEYRIQTDVDSIAEAHRLWRDGSPLATRYEVEANARLIAAAPDLLEACKAFVAAYTDTEHAEQETVWQQAVTAIARAEGSQP